MKSGIKTQSTWWHWSVVTLVGLSVTYLWLWILAYSPMHQPKVDAVTLNVILEMQQPNVEEPPEEPASVSVSQPMPVEPMPAEAVVPIMPPIMPPKLRAPIPVLVVARKIAPPLPEARPAVAAALQPAPVENVPQPPLPPAPPSLDPVPVSRLTRTPTFVHKALPNDPEDVQIPPGGVRVIARITLDETAAVRNVQIDKSGETPFDVAVISAIHRSRFTPGYIGDHPVATVFNQTYRFQLQ